MRRVSTIAFLLACAAGVCRAQHHACISHKGWFYDLKSDASITTLDRYQGTTFFDRQHYAPFHLPAPGTTTWDEGVAFAATMQTRNAWLNTEQTAAATWVYDAGAGQDTWTWRTTENGVPVQYVFTTSNCNAASNPPPPPPPTTMTAAPTTTAAPTPAGAVHHACTSHNGWYYDLKSDASITTLDRYQGTTFVDRQHYAAFHMPAPGTTTWDEGVAFAATMQTRNAWLNTEQTSAATWVHEDSTGKDMWTWSTTENGAPVQYVFYTNNCL